MNIRNVIGAAVLSCLGLCSSLLAQPPQPAQPPPINFNKEIQPLLKQQCVTCHNPKSAKGGLVLDNLASLQKGGKSGEAIIGGMSWKSLLMHRITGDVTPRMPFEAEPLSAQQIELLRKWINQQASKRGFNPPNPFPEVIRGQQSLSIPIPLRPTRDPAGPSLEGTLEVGPAIAVAALGFSPDGKTLAVGGYQEVVLWDLEHARLLRRLGDGEFGNLLHALAFHPNGRLLAVGEGTPAGPGAVKVLDLETGKPAFSFTEPKDAAPKDVVYALAFSPDGKMLAAGAGDAHVYVWNLDEKKLATTLKDHGDWVLGVAFSPDGKYLATCGADRVVQLWEVEGWKSIAKVQQNEPVCGVVFSPDSADGQTLAWAVGGPTERMVRMRKVEGFLLENAPVDPKAPKKPSPPIKNMDPGAGVPLGIAWTGQGDRGSKIFVPCADKTIKVFNGFGGLAATLTGHGDWVYCTAVSPDGTKLASGSGDGTVKLWSVADNRLLATLVQPSVHSDDWLILAPQGYFTASSASLLRWKTKGLTTPPEKLTSLFEDAEAIRAVLAGNKNIGLPVVQ